MINYLKLKLMFIDFKFNSFKIEFIYIPLYDLSNLFICETNLDATFCIL